MSVRECASHFKLADFYFQERKLQTFLFFLFTGSEDDEQITHQIDYILYRTMRGYGG